MKYVNGHFSAAQAEAFVRHEDGEAAMPPAERLAISDHAAECVECRALIQAAASAGDTASRTERVLTGLLEVTRAEEDSADDWRGDLTLPARTPGELADLRAFEKRAAEFEPEQFAPGGTLGGVKSVQRGRVAANQPAPRAGGWWQWWMAWQWAGAAAGLAAVAIAAIWMVDLRERGSRDVGAGAVAKNHPSVGISDGPLRVSAEGKLEGAELLPVNLRNAVVETIRRGAAPGALLGNVTRGGPVHPAATNHGSVRWPYFPLEFPVGTTVESDQPTLRWNEAVSDAHIEVVIQPSEGGDPIHSGPLPGMQLEWTIPQPLPRGQFYRWQAKIGAAALVGEPSPGGTFKVLSVEAHERLEALRRGPAGQSHLALGVAYAREGMREAAQEEFRRLQEENARSPLARQLTDSLVGE